MSYYSSINPKSQNGLQKFGQVNNNKSQIFNLGIEAKTKFYLSQLYPCQWANCSITHSGISITNYSSSFFSKNDFPLLTDISQLLQSCDNPTFYLMILPHIVELFCTFFFSPSPTNFSQNSNKNLTLTVLKIRLPKMAPWGYGKNIT